MKTRALIYDAARAVGEKRWTMAAASLGGWALPEGEFEHRSGMISKAETRALVHEFVLPGLLGPQSLPRG